MAMTFDVPPDFDGQRLDRFLVSVLASHSRSQIQKLVAGGHVTINSPSSPRSGGPKEGGATGARRARQAKANLVLHEGDEVVVDVPAPVETSIEREELPLEILFQDAD